MKEEIHVKTWKDVHPSGLVAIHVMKKPSLYQDTAVKQGRQKQCSCPAQVKPMVELDRRQGDLTLNQFCYYLASIISSPSPQKATLLETSVGILLEKKKKKIKTVTGQKKVGSSCRCSEVAGEDTSGQQKAWEAYCSKSTIQLVIIARLGLEGT